MNVALVIAGVGTGAGRVEFVLGSSTVLAGKITADTAAPEVRGATTDGRAGFVITTSTLRPADPSVFAT